MGQLDTANQIADGVNARDTRHVVFIHFDISAVHLRLGAICEEPFCDRPPACGNENVLAGRSRFLALLFIGRHDKTILSFRESFHHSGGVDIHAALL